MPFLSESLEALTRQLVFAPVARRRLQIDHAEAFYWQIEAERVYPLEFIVYRLTQYRPDTVDNTMLIGSAVRHDLLMLVEQLSKSLDEPASNYSPVPVDLPDLCRRMNVTAKTISRWRRQGLFARSIRWEDGRKRVAFLPASIDRFLASQKPRIEKAAKFSRIDLRTSRRIIERARRIAGRVEVSPFRIARHLAGKSGRSVETIRQLLLQHDRRHPQHAIFLKHFPPLTERQHRVIYRAYARGVPVAKMARRFHRTRDAIYRGINQRRAAALAQRTIRYVANPTFEMPDAEQVILDSGPIETQHQPGDGDHPFSDPQVELALFVRYNYLKFRAAISRDSLDKYQPRSGQIDQIETFLRRAAVVKQLLIRAHLRLVVSMARKHLATTHNPAVTLADLTSEGNVVLVEAIETYDPGRGNRFSTYLTWALMRHFARFTSHLPPRTLRLEQGSETQEGWLANIDSRPGLMEHAEAVQQTLAKLLGELEERERFILTRHFGLAGADGKHNQPATLADVAAQIKISAERARQIEQRALQKLRAAAARLKISLADADLFSPPPNQGT
jgi:RNA polymerase primary sigma factor